MPGVTLIVPSSSTVTVTLLPSSSFALTFVSVSLLTTLIPLSCGSFVGFTVLGVPSTLVFALLSELLSSVPSVWPSTGTLISFFPPSRSGSSIVKVIGPSTFVPGVTLTVPSSSTVTLTLFPSSSFALTFVSLSLLTILIPVSCDSLFGLTSLASPSTLVLALLSELLSSLPSVWPSTGTLISFFPPSRSGSSIVKVIGPSTFVPGVTLIVPSSSTVTVTLLPSSSFALTFVSVSLLTTLIPLSCGSFVGFTVLGVPVTSVLPFPTVLLSSTPFLWSFTGTSISCFPSVKSGSSIVRVIGPSTFIPGITLMLPSSSTITFTTLLSSSFALTLVSLSLLTIFIPVSCGSFVGLTSLAVPSTFVFGLDSGSFGSVFSFFSSSSDTPSPSSSLS